MYEAYGCPIQARSWLEWDTLAPLLFTEIYKTLPAFTNLYRTDRAPMLKSKYRTQAIEMIVAVVSTI